MLYSPLTLRSCCLIYVKPANTLVMILHDAKNMPLKAYAALSAKRIATR